MHLSKREIPNILTLFRGILAVGAVVVFYIDIQYLYQVLLAIFLLACVSDYLDGVLARRWHAQSDFGKVFDPLFDKVIVFVFFFILFPTDTIPHLAILLTVIRDLVVDGLRSAYAARGVVIPAIWSAKLKTTLAFLAIISALLALTFGSTLLHITTAVLSWAMLIAALGSAAHYARIFWEAEKNLSKPKIASSHQ